ncbi:MAG: hypothetical protein JOS17DRAFT_792457 [Linnemannia elongata]|nr:MAG: hypothetical protein JOS17DRAFT_792457 [Linnemannia elongata]
MRTTAALARRQDHALYSSVNAMMSGYSGCEQPGVDFIGAAAVCQAPPRKRYNYLTSAALDTGAAICGLVIFFSIQSWEEPSFLIWWVNPNPPTTALSEVQTTTAFLT